MRSFHFSVIAILMAFGVTALVASDARADGCYSGCQQAELACEGDAQDELLEDQLNCWYAYGWACQYAEPGQDYGVCQDHSTCLWYADLNWQYSVQQCQYAFDRCANVCASCDDDPENPFPLPCG